jgi:hypothetical protein
MDVGMGKVRRGTPPAEIVDVAIAIQRDPQTLPGRRERRADDLTSPDQHHATSVDQELALLSSRRSADTTHHPSERRAPSVSVVIPTLNEAANLPHVITRVAQEYEVIVVDGGSTDDTMQVARDLRPDAIVMRQPGQGKGDALFAGFRVARGDIIVTLDADGSQNAGEIESFVAALVAGADFAKGSRLIAGGGSADFTRLRAAGNRALGMAANVIHGTAYTDLTYGFNAFWRHCVPYLVNDAAGFEGETIMCIRAARAGLRTAEVVCYEDHRIHGESNLRTFRDGWRILRLLVNERRSAVVVIASATSADAPAAPGLSVALVGVGVDDVPSPATAPALTIVETAQTAALASSVDAGARRSLLRQRFSRRASTLATDELDIALDLAGEAQG